MSVFFLYTYIWPNYTFQSREFAIYYIITLICVSNYNLILCLSQEIYIIIPTCTIHTIIIDKKIFHFGIVVYQYSQYFIIYHTLIFRKSIIASIKWDHITYNNSLSASVLLSLRVWRWGYHLGIIHEDWLAHNIAKYSWFYIPFNDRRCAQ